jgi:hypothetical protein
MIETRYESSMQVPDWRKAFRFDADSGDMHTEQDSYDGVSSLMIGRRRNSHLLQSFRFTDLEAIH